MEISNTISKGILDAIEKELISAPNLSYNESELKCYESGYYSILEIVRVSNQLQLDLVSYSAGVNKCIEVLKDLNLV